MRRGIRNIMFPVFPFCLTSPLIYHASGCERENLCGGRTAYLEREIQIRCVEDGGLGNVRAEENG